MKENFYQNYTITIISFHATKSEICWLDVSPKSAFSVPIICCSWVLCIFFQGNRHLSTQTLIFQDEHLNRIFFTSIQALSAPLIFVTSKTPDVGTILLRFCLAAKRKALVAQEIFKWQCVRVKEVTVAVSRKASLRTTTSDQSNKTAARRGY